MKLSKKFAMPFLSLALMMPITSVISCSSQSDDNHYFDDDITPPNNNVIEDNRTIETYLLDIEWLQGFRDQKTSYITSEEDFIFEPNQILLDDKKFTIEYVGQNELGKHNFSLFDKEINKFYLATIDTEFEQLDKNFSLSNIKNYLCKNLINNYQQNMIINHSISDDNFFIPIDTSDKSISFENNEISFYTAQECKDGLDSTLNYNIKLSSKKIREILFGGQEQNFQNFKIKDFTLKDLYLLPMTMCLENFDFSNISYRVNVVRNNDDYKNKWLTRDETSSVDLEIPTNNLDYCTYTHQQINNKTYTGYIVKTEYTEGISSKMNSIIDSNNPNYENLYDRIVKNSKGKFNSYTDQIFNYGKRIKMDYKYDFVENKDSLVSFNIQSKLHSLVLPNPLLFFGKREGLGVYNVKALQKMSLNFTEYKKF